MSLLRIAMFRWPCICLLSCQRGNASCRVVLSLQIVVDRTDLLQMQWFLTTRRDATRSEKGLHHSQIPGRTDMSDGVMTPEKKTLLDWCGPARLAGKTSIHCKMTVVEVKKKEGFNKLVLFHILVEFTHNL